MFLFRDKQILLNKELRPALHVIFGIGWLKSIVITSKLGFSFPFFINNINHYNFSLIFFFLKTAIATESKIRRVVSNKLNSLTDTKAYRGLRHLLYLPVRGQRTRTNAGTRRRLKFS